jgi:hypothetical protein
MHGCGGASRKTRGQSVPLAALLLWFVAGVTLVLAGVGELAIDRSRAQAGADAVALGIAAGADGQRLASANAVMLERLERGDDVDVVVRSGGATAAARAAVQRSWRGLDPAMQLALAQAESILGRHIPIVSGRRSRADQERLWANRHNNPYPVAPPGTSDHELGLAIDVPLTVAGPLAALGDQVGLCRPLPVTDPVHFIVCGVGV